MIRPDARQVRSAYPLYGGIQDYLQRDQPSRGSITRREAKCRPGSSFRTATESSCRPNPVWFDRHQSTPIGSWTARCASCRPNPVWFERHQHQQIGAGGGLVSGDRHGDIADHMTKLRACAAKRPAKARISSWPLMSMTGLGRRFGSLNVHEFVGAVADYPEIIDVRKRPKITAAISGVPGIRTSPTWNSRRWARSFMPVRSPISG